MNLFSFIYNELLFRPLFNLLVVITNFMPGHNVGASILIVTIIVRLILIPPSLHQARQVQKNQTKMAELKNQLNKIKKKYAKDQTKKAEETMRLYKDAGINPASGCLPLLIQLPILIALYRVFLVGINPDTYQFLYGFVPSPDVVGFTFLTIDLTQNSLLLAIAAGVFQLILMKSVSPAQQASLSADDQSAQMMASMKKNMSFIFPIMTVFIAMQLPAALALYWVATTIFGIVQQYVFKKYLNIASSVAM
jgi:YidC/Oxa1 family membrane protein insertase